MILLYSEIQSARLAFAVKAFFEPYGISVELTSNKEDFLQETERIRICYGAKNLFPEVLNIPSEGLLFETGTREMEIKAQRNFNWNWDVFSWTFFFLSQYEEYLPCERDQYGRRLGTSSWLHKENHLREPLIDRWRMQLMHDLSLKFPEIIFPKTHSYQAITIDVDSAFAYKHKGFYRTTGGMVKDVLHGRFKNLWNRLQTLAGFKHDEFDTYEAFEKIAEHHHVKLIWFFLLADFRGEDISIPYNQRALRELVRRLNKKYIVGIHPGLKSNDDPAILKQEVHRLKHIIRKDVLHSRQHFIKFDILETYDRLIDAGIEHEYSVGFHDVIGFKAATGWPFPYYDLRSESTRDLTLHPFVAMDATLKRYMKLSPEVAFDVLREIKQTCWHLKSPFVLLWHNETLSDTHGWEGYGQLLEDITVEPF